MQLNRFAYCGNGAPAATRPRLPPFRGNGRWETLDADTFAEVCVHLNDRQLARLSNVDRRTLKLARIAIQRHLGLSASQWAVFDAVLHRREDVLLMGAPGTGKSFLLKILRERVRNPLVTASTAAAADKIGAMTLHSALSLGLGDKPVEEIMKRLKRPHNAHGQETINTITNSTTLILDEVSMLTAKLLRLAEEVLLKVRGRLPQLVVSGDPMQLGAVAAAREGSFYDAELVQRLRPYVLLEAHRQTEDSEFLRILNAARMGRAREADAKWLRANFCPKVPDSAPKLFCRIYEVERHNNEMLDALTMPLVFSYPLTTGKIPNGTPTASAFTVGLKVGARVLLTRNVPELVARGLHNGSCGRVASLSEGSVAVVFDNGATVAVKKIVQDFEEHGKITGTLTFLPLVLAWAVSVHRAQGATLDAMYVDLGKCFAAGQAYVALSRVREAAHAQVDNLQLFHVNNIDRPALNFYNRCSERSEKRAERRAERARVHALAMQYVDDDALEQMMNEFEAQQPK